MVYYKPAHGDGSTPATREAAVDVGGDCRPAPERRASVLHATESDPRSTCLRQVRRTTLPAILRGGRPARTVARSLLPAVADWPFRRPGRRARDRVAGGRFGCAARFSRLGAAGRATGSFDDLAHASLDRSRDAR